MSRTGRPRIYDEKKNRALQFRVTQTTINKLEECSKELNITRTAVIEKGIDIIHDSLNKKETE